MLIPDFFRRMQGKKQMWQILEILIVISSTSILFVWLETNMMVFGFFVYAGFAWMIYSTPNLKVSVLTGMAGGAVGALTEYWGCSNHLWNWVTPCKSLWMIGGQESGFPVEVVIAYFASGFWITKISINLFTPEHNITQGHFSEIGVMKRLSNRALVILGVSLIGIAVPIIEPVYLQSMLLIVTGTIIALLLPKPAMIAVGVFAVIMGSVGLFFENFATGIFDSFAVWRYDLSLHTNLSIPIPIVGTAPFSAFIAYMGTGLILFGLSFLLNRQSPEGGHYA